MFKYHLPLIRAPPFTGKIIALKQDATSAHFYSRMSMWKYIQDLEEENQRLNKQLTGILKQKNMNENLAGNTRAMMDSLHTQVGELAENQLLRMKAEEKMQNTDQLSIISAKNEELCKILEENRTQINALKEDHASYKAMSIITDAEIAQELERLEKIIARDEAQAKIRAYGK
ncbi:hypothetical protein F5884DRAFT_203953 [Xylogone sp. PMI_703]|nr:hypothetical protein F5884DRAFT_203953 [Xylogone sp. PMI_703]